MNTRLNRGSELFRGIYLIDNANYADLILTFHHVTIDAASDMNLLDELLKISAALQMDEEPSLPALEVLPPLEERFPAPFKGLRGVAKMTGYALAQMTEEMQYQVRTRAKRRPAIQLVVG